MQDLGDNIFCSKLNIDQLVNPEPEPSHPPQPHVNPNLLGQPPFKSNPPSLPPFNPNPPNHPPFNPNPPSQLPSNYNPPACPIYRPGRPPYRPIASGSPPINPNAPGQSQVNHNPLDQWQVNPNAQSNSQVNANYQTNTYRGYTESGPIMYPIYHHTNVGNRGYINPDTGQPYYSNQPFAANIADAMEDHTVNHRTTPRDRYNIPKGVLDPNSERFLYQFTGYHKPSKYGVQWLHNTAELTILLRRLK